MADERTFRALTPKLIKWEEKGESVEGTLQGKSVMQFEDNEVGQYSIRGDDGTLYGVLGGKIIDEALEDVDVGAYIRIVFGGQEHTRSGQQINLFEVLIADEHSEATVA